MIIALQRRFSQSMFLHGAALLFFIVGILVVGYFAMCIYELRGNTEKVGAFQYEKSLGVVKATTSDIERDPFALKASFGEMLLSQVDRLFEVVSIDRRPLPVRGHRERVLIKLGNTHHVISSEEPLEVPRSSDEARVKIALQSVSSKSAKFAIEVALPSEGSTDLKVFSAMTEKEFSPLEIDSKLLFADRLSKGALYGEDQLLKIYGGVEYAHMDGKCKFGIPTETGESILFLREGDMLIWDGVNWRRPKKDDQIDKSPLAEVVSLSAQKAVFDCYSSEDFSYRQFSFAPQKCVDDEVDITSLLSEFTFRGEGVLTCRIGNRRFVLKEGDWWLKTPSGWHNISSLKGIDDVLTHRDRGQLFIFDHVVKRDGKRFLLGHHFNTLRTEARSLEIPCKQRETKKKSPSGHVKNTGTSKEKSSRYKVEFGEV